MDAGTGRGDLLAGRYRLIEELGRGGMGVVWRAADELLGRQVAVKEVKAPDGLDDGHVSQLYARLEQEGRAAARVEHPNVITVYDVANQDGRPWIVMELVRGLSLADVLEAEGPMTPQRAAEVGGKVLAALRVAHAAGVLHRDVKPGNVLIANDGRVVLTDFGIAVIEGSSSITRTGEIVGSPEFLAPERAFGRTPGPESDLWSLGITLYAAVEGRSPFRRASAINTLQAVVDAELPPPQRAGALAPVLAGLLCKDPAQRLGGEQAQRMLDHLAAGAADPSAEPLPAAGYTPTVRTDTPPQPQPRPQTQPEPEPEAPRLPTVTNQTNQQPQGTGPQAGVQPGQPGQPGHDRRRRPALIAAVAALVLAGGALAVSALGLVDWPGSNGDRAGGSAASAATAGQGGDASRSVDTTRGSDGAQSASAGTGTTGAGHATNGNSWGNDSYPGTGTIDVWVYVSAVRDSYSGSCPPPAAEAPYFTATIKVSRTPAQVTYRWRTSNGGSSDPEWKTLHFADGGPKQKTVDYTHLGYLPGQSTTGWVAVDVKSPKALQSNHATFTTECVDATSSPGSSTAGAGGGSGTTPGGESGY